MKRTLLSFLGIAVTIILTTYTNAFAGPGVDKNAMKPAGLSFIENKGQVRDQNRNPRADIQFSLKAAGGLTIFIGDGAMHYQFSKPDKEVAKPSKQDMMNPDLKPEQVTYTMDRMDVELLGANKHAQVIAAQKQEYYENYFTDWSGEKGATAHAFGKITYKDIYPNIDWVLYINNGQLKHEFVVKAGGKVSDIQLKYGGTKDLKLNTDGSLTAATPQGTITEQAPNTYQRDGKKVASSFRLSNNVISYSTGEYVGELVIDPTLAWATYFGGSNEDVARDNTTDPSGNVFITGQTVSTSSIATSGAFNNTYGGGAYDAFLAKFDRAGAIQWATYYGNSATDQAFGVATDASGNVFMTGVTNSALGIATAGAYQTALSAPPSSNAFLVKFNSSGARIWGTYFGGNVGGEQGYAIATDASGDVCMVGRTVSLSGIATLGAYQTTAGGGGNDGFLAKFSSIGNLQWATYYCSSGDDIVLNVATDAGSNIFISGQTNSPTGMATLGAYQTTNGGTYDAFIAKFNSTGTIQWGTYYGGSLQELGWGLATDVSGNAYLAGTANSTSGIATSGAYQTTYGGGSDGFLAQFSGSGGLVWATYFGGSGGDAAWGVATDPSSNVYLTGYTASTSGISTSGAYQTIYGGGVYDAFLAEFTNTGSILFATYYGVSGDDVAYRIAVDATGSNAYIAGITTSTTGIATAGAYQTTNGGGSFDAMLISFCMSPPVVAAITGPSAGVPGGTFTLSDATASGTWASSATSIATVNTSGVVSGVSAGTTVISYSVANTCGTTTVTKTITILPLSPCVPANGLVAWYPFTGNANDSSGNGNNGTVTGATLTTDRFGVANSAYSFNGTSDYISASATAALNFTDHLTISAWVKMNVASTDQAILGKQRTPAATGFNLLATNGTLKYSFGLHDGVTNATDDALDTLSPAVWHHLSAVYDGTTMSLYRDGSLVNTSTFSISLVPSTELLFIGKEGALGRFFNGSIDDIALYDRALDPCEINQLYSCSATVTAGTITGASSVCQGSTTSYIDGVTGGIWRSSNTSVATAGSTGIITGVAAGTTIISYAVINPCGSAFATQTLTVIPSAAPITGPVTVCPGGIITLSETTTGGAWASSNTAIATVTSSGVVTGVTVGNVIISYTVASTCVPTSMALISVGYPIITTIAGNGTYGYTGDGLAAISAQLSSVTSVAADNSGNIYIADFDNSVIRKVSATGIITTVAGNGTAGFGGDNGPATSAMLNGPYGVVADGSGNIYIADDFNSRIRKVSAAGIITTYAGSATSGFFGDDGPATSARILNPNQLALDAVGNLFIADGGNNRIRKVSTAGIITTVAGNGTAGFSVDGVAATTSRINAAPGVAVDAAGNIYIADGLNHRVRKVDPSGIISTIAGTGSLGSTGDGGAATAALLNDVTSVAVDVTGNIYISDQHNFKIRRINTSGIINTISGSGSSGYSGDNGIATAGVMSDPYDVAVDANGNLYIADIGNGRVRKIAPPNLTVSGPGTVCQASTITLTDATLSGTWSSSNTAVATVGTSSGIVTGTGSGTAIITYTFASPCGPLYGTKTVSVTALPSAISGASTTCVGSNLTLTDPSGAGTWISSSTGVATIGSGTGTLGGVAVGTSTITFTLTSTGCSITRVQTVNALPSAISGSSTTCVGSNLTLSDPSGAGTWVSSNTGVATIGGGTGTLGGVAAGTTTITFTLTATGCAITRTQTIIALPSAISGPLAVCAGSTVTLSDPTGAGTWVSSNTAAATVVSGTGVVSGVAAGTTTITFTLTATGCTITRTETVNALPSAISGASTTCVGSNLTLTDPSGAGTWVSSNTAAATIGGGSGTLGGVAAGTSTITFTLTSTGCTATRIQTVDALPSAISGVASVCAGSNTTLTDPSGAGTWVSSNTGVGTIGGGTGTVGGVSAGTTTITFTLTTTGCTITRTETINPLPVAGSITGTLTVCPTGTSALADAAGGGVWSSATTSVATITGAGLVTGVAPGTTTISYTVTNGCGTAVATAVVTVSPTATAGSITGTATVCAGSTTTLVDGAGGGVWSSVTTSVATVDAAGLVTGVSAGASTISYTVTNSCGTAVATRIVTVNPLPVAGSITGTTALCPTATTTLSDAAGGGVWSSTNTAVGTITGAGLVTAVAPGATTISYTVTNGCGTIAATVVFTVNPAPNAGSITGTASACPGTTTPLTDAAGGGVWSSTNTAVATTDPAGVVTGVAAGTTTISYTVTNSCGTAATTVVVTVTASPVAGSISGSSTICVSTTTTLTDAAGGGIWSSSNTAIASVSTTGVVSGLSTGTVNIAYTVTNSCGTAVANYAVNVLAAPVAGTIIGAATVCAGTYTVYVDAASGGLWGVSNSRASIIGTGLLTGITPGLDTISYTVTNVCGTATTTKIVNIGPLLTVGAISGPSSVCVGSTITLTDTSTTGTWSSSYTSMAIVSSTGVVTALSGGLDTIYYTVTSGCGAAIAAHLVNVIPIPTGGTISGPIAVCAGMTATYTSTATGGVWGTSNATASINSFGLLTAVTPASDTVLYVVTNACGTATSMFPMVIAPAITAGTISGGSTLCEGSTITLTDATTGGIWSTSNASASVTGGLVTGLAAGIDTIGYTVTSSCGSVSTTHTITVSPLPNAGSISGSANVCIGSAITLTDAAPGGFWTASNARATVTGGIVTGMSTGAVVISYAVINSCGTAIATKTITVSTVPTAGSLSGATNVCIGSLIVLTDATTGGIWTASNARATVIGGTVTGSTTGIDTIYYTVTTSCGTASASATVSVNPLPVAGSILGSTSVCAGSSVLLTSTIAGGAWSVTNANATITTGGSLTGVTAGLDTVVYAVTNSCGTATATSVITINALPSAGTISGPSVVCVSASIVLADPSAGGVWSASNANATVVGGTVTGATVGIDTIGYTVTNACGTAVTSTIITINPLPVAGTISGPTSVCSGATITLTDPATGGVWSSSLPAIASVTSGGIVTGGTAGSTTIAYSVTNSCGTASAVTTVNVNALPDAGVITGASNVCPGSTITLASTIAGGAWSSNNTHASVTAGIVTGVSAGADTIVYTISNACGTATTSKTLTIHPLPTSGTIIGVSEVCTGSLITLTETVSGGTWSAGNANATISTVGMVAGITPGLDTVRYTFTNACGNAVVVKVITVNATPSAGSITGASELCIGASTTLSNPVTGGIWSSSNTAVASVTTTGVVMGMAAGTASINYTMNNGCGAAIATHSVVVLPLTNCNTLVKGVANQQNELKVYPNPSEGVFAVTLVSDSKTAVHVVITNIVGQQTNEYTTETNTELMIHLNQPAGTYLLSATTATGKWTTKFTIR